MAEFAKTVARIDGSVFLVVCSDVEGSADVRESELLAHLEYVERHVQEYLLAGPLRNPGETPLTGSFFLVAANSADEARTIVAGDPYVKSGIYQDIIVHEAVPAAGRLLGGVIWDAPEALKGKSA